MPKPFKLIKDKVSKLGPGFITGAADDDPSGVATYSIAGAKYGYRLNWLSLFLIPMMIAVQEMSARIGLVSGRGLAGTINKYYSKKLLYVTVSLLAIANIINIGADLGMMAESVKMILGLPFVIWLIIIAVGTILMEVFIPYKKYYNYLKWMGATLLVYMVTAFLVKQDWGQVLSNTVIPHIDFNLAYVMTLVGFIGTTISPYLFFWEPAEEIEEEIKEGKITDFAQKPHVAKFEVKQMQKDTVAGMIFSNLISTFIVITAAATLHVSGITDIETPRQAALALKPLAGDFAFILFTVGIIGIGLQSVPILAGGVAYAFSETFGFKEGLSKKFREAKFFYIILAVATGVGALMNIIGINPIKALFYTAIINGVISIPLIAIIIRLADDPRVVGINRTSKKIKGIAYITLVFISISALLMFYSLLKH
ncbi:MAG TPA: divalent metal cation transporter [Patescibacteria group bacterium]